MFFYMIISFLFPGKLWSRSLKLAYTLLNKLGTKNEPVLKPGDRVIVFFLFFFLFFREVMFYCFLACTFWTFFDVQQHNL